MPAIAQTFPLFFLNQDRYRQNVINGGFDIWQRGRSFTVWAGEYYTADRFVGTSGDTVHPMYVEHYSLPVDNSVRAYGIKNAMRIYRTNATAGTFNPSILTKIPGAEYGAGDSVSFGMWMWADAPLTLDRIGLNREYGSGGTPSAKEYYSFATAVTIGTTPTFYEFSLNLGSIVGKTFGTDGNDCLEIVLWFPKNTLFNCYTTGWQMNTGARCLPYQPKTESQELAACLLFFERQNVAGNFLPSPAMAWDSSHVWANLTFTPKWRPPNNVALSIVPRFQYWKDGYARSFSAESWAYADATETTIQGQFEVNYDPGPKGSVYVWQASAGSPVWIDISSEL